MACALACSSASAAACALSLDASPTRVPDGDPLRGDWPDPREFRLHNIPEWPWQEGLWQATALLTDGASLGDSCTRLVRRRHARSTPPLPNEGRPIAMIPGHSGCWRATPSSLSLSQAPSRTQHCCRPSCCSPPVEREPILDVHARAWKILFGSASGWLASVIDFVVAYGFLVSLIYVSKLSVPIH
jgi:hypothetical protein